jgi:hypothetical protein
MFIYCTHSDLDLMYDGITFINSQLPSLPSKEH